MPILLLLSIGLTPFCAADQPVTGNLRVVGEGEFNGIARLDDVVVFVPAETIELSWEDGTIRQVERSWRRVLVTEGSGAPVVTSYPLRAGRLLEADCLEARCGTYVAIDPVSPMTLSRVVIGGDAWSFHAGSSEPSDPGADHWIMDFPGRVTLSAGTTLISESAALLASGTRLHTAEPPNIRFFDAKTSRESVLDPLTGMTIAAVTNASHIRAQLRGVELGTQQDSPALAQVRRVHVEGTASFPQAEGWVRVGGDRRTVDHAPVLLEGTFDITIGPQGEVAFSGRGTYVFVGEVSVYEERSAPRHALVLTTLLLIVVRYLPALYTRLRPGLVLNNPVRADVYSIIVHQPGVGLSGLMERARLGRGTLRYQLRILEWAGRVRRERRGGRDCYYPRGYPPPDATDPGKTDAQTRMIVLDRLRSAGGTGRHPSPRELAEATGIKRRLVSYHLQHLLRLGLVAREGYPHRYHIVPRDRT